MFSYYALLFIVHGYEDFKPSMLGGSGLEDNRTLIFFLDYECSKEEYPITAEKPSTAGHP